MTINKKLIFKSIRDRLSGPVNNNADHTYLFLDADELYHLCILLGEQEIINKEFLKGDVKMKKFLIFVGQEFYANGGANDLITSDCKTEEGAIKHAKSLMNKRFTTNYWGSDNEVESTIEWVQVFSIEKCRIIYKEGRVFGDDSGLIILK